MKCPNCNETLLMTQRNNIEIDYCPTCRGVWLDRGELDKILEQSSRNASFDDPHEQEFGKPGKYNPYDVYRNDKGAVYSKQRKKKSFLGDLFDFD
ncbi:MAG: zf-TFIIB domain-containing protein [Candidatus Dadabacteria bacterium]